MIHRLLAPLALLICTASTLIGAPLQYENQSVERLTIIVEGTTATQEFMERSVRARIKTREGDFFSQTTFDQDLKSLVQEFDRVDPILESVDGRMRITLHIWTKPTIRCIVWEGNKKVDTSDLQSELGITAYSIFDRYNFNQAFHKLKSYYIKKGYFEAELSYHLDLDEESNEVEITICIKEGRAGRIRQIYFHCFTKEEENDLLDMMITKKYNFFTSWFTEEGTYNEDAVQQDQFIILNYLQNKGYADAEVAINVSEAQEKNRINISITAAKGERYTFGPITFEGNSTLCDEEVARLFRVCEGSYFSPEKIRQTIDNITKKYGRCGYIDAYVDYEPRLDIDCRSYSVHFKIDEGEKYCVGLIRVFGNCATQTRVILHETLLIPGEVFNLDKLRLTEQRLQNVGYFKNVNVYAVRTDEEGSCLGGNYRDVNIEVEECGTGSFGAFAGYSTAESLFAGGNLTERNFNAKGLWKVWDCGLRSLRGGGEYFHLNATIGLKSRKYVMSWTKPFFRDTRWSVGFDIENATNRYISNDYTINSWGFTPHASYDYNAYVRVGWHYRLRYSYVTMDKDLKDEKKNDGIISAVGTSLIYDSTDNPSRPTAGYRSRLETEFAGLGGESNFIAFAYLNTYYFRMDKRGVLKMRSDFRFITTYGATHFADLPLDERIFLGGENEIRGYKPYRLGPKFHHKDQDPKGGISMQLYSIEYQRRLFQKLDAFLFIDAGYLSKLQWTFGSPYTAAGFGFRFQVFENGPPLTLGYGVPINARDKHDVKRFFMTVGGRF